MERITLYCYQCEEKLQKEIRKNIQVLGPRARIIPVKSEKEFSHIDPEPHASVFLVSRKNQAGKLTAVLKKIRRTYSANPLIIVGERCPGEEISRYIRAGAGSYLETIRLYALPDIIRQLLLEDPLKDLSPEAMLAHYEFLLNISGNQLSMIDRNYIYLAINDAFCAAHKLIREEVVGKKPDEIWGGDNFRKIIRPKLEQCFTSEKVHYQAWFDVKGRGKRFFEVTFYPHKNYAGKVDYVVVETKDITLQEEVKDELETKNADLRFINGLNKLLDKQATSGEVGEFVCDTLLKAFDGFTTSLYFFNQAEEKLIPVSFKLREEILRKTESITGEKTGSTKIGYFRVSMLVRVMKQKKIHLLERKDQIKRLIREMVRDRQEILSNLDKLLEHFPVKGVLLIPLVSADEDLGMLTLARLKRFTDKDIDRLNVISGQITHILLSRKREEEKKQQAEKLQLLFDHAMDSIILLKGNRFVDCNPQTLKTFGVDRDKIIGATLLDFSPDYQPGGIASAKLAQQYIEKALRGQPQSFEWMHLRGDGTTFYALVNLNRMGLEGGDSLQSIVRDIDALKRTYVELEEKERSLREAQEIASIGNWDMHLKKKRHFWSAQVYSILEYSPEKTVPSQAAFYERLHPEDRRRVRLKVKESIQKGQNYDDIYRLKMPDGRIKYIHGRGKPLKDDNNEVVRFRGTIQDISEIKQAEQEIRERSVRLDLINKVNADLNDGKPLYHVVKNLKKNLSILYPVSHIAIFTKDILPESFTLLTSTLGKAQRSKVVEFIGRPLKQFYIPDNPGNRICRFFYSSKHLLITDQEILEELFEGFIKLLGLNGSGSMFYKLMNVRSVLVYPVVESEKLKYLIVMLSNKVLSETVADKLNMLMDQIQVVIRKKLDEMEMQRLYTAIEQMDEIMFISNRDGAILYMNPAGQKLTGKKIHEFIGRNTREFRNPEMDNEVYDRIWKTVTSGITWQGELKLLTTHKQSLDVHTIITPIKDDRNNVISFVTLMRDISKEKEMQQFMQRSQKLEMIGRFAGGLAHDFNNILATMVGYGDMARDELPDDHVAAEYLDKLKNSGLKARELIRQLLTFNRSVEPQLTLFSPIQMVNDSITLIKPQIPRHVTIDTTGIDKAVMPAADIFQFKQVVLNLLTNAVRAVEKKPEGLIRISTGLVEAGRKSPVKGLEESSGSYYFFKVSDNGIGMSQDTVSHMFEPFFTTQPVGKGSGMGLSVVYGIVSAHNGKITVDSKSGEGTTITVFLPYTR